MKESLTIITTFNEELWEKYANRTIPSWMSNFDESVEFHFHTDGFKPLNDPRIKYFLDSKEKKNFIKRNDHVPVRGASTNWRAYCHKVFSQIDSSRISDNKLMMFLDADIAMLKPFSYDAASKFLDNKFCGCVLRDNHNTETGLILYDLSHINSKLFFNTFENLYLSGDLFHLPQLDDCYAFDVCRRRLDIEVSNLSGEYRWFIDPIAVGPLGEFFDHWISKNSKIRGYSKHRKFRGKI